MSKSEPQHLGRNDARTRTTPKLGDSEQFPGMQSVQPEVSGHYESRTGTAGSGKK